jgi:hypothetical protein
VVVLVLWFGIGVAGPPGHTGHPWHQTVWLVEPWATAVALLAVARGLLVAGRGDGPTVPRWSFAIAAAGAIAGAGLAIAQLPQIYDFEIAPIAVPIVEGGALVYAMSGLATIAQHARLHELRGSALGSIVAVMVVMAMALAAMVLAHRGHPVISLAATMLQIAATAIVAARCRATRNALTRAPGLPAARILSGS